MANRLLLILGDQLSLTYLVDILNCNPSEDTILMVESSDFVRRKPYHAKKIVLVWSAMRHFAQELRDNGYAVEYVTSEGRYRDVVQQTFLARNCTSLAFIRPRERSTRNGLIRFLQDANLPFEEFADPFWYTSPVQFTEWLGKRTKPKMEDYYRWVRTRTGILMESGKPEGGEWNYDHENRKPFPKNHAPIAPFQTEPDAITRDVMEAVRAISGLSGSVEGFALPVNRTEALAGLTYFATHLLPRFGAHEDAMSSVDGFGFHAVISLSLNLSLLSPQECVEAVLAAHKNAHAPISSIEGFIRQIIGWREFMYHMFESYTGNYHETNALEHTRPLPKFYWTGETKMRCLSIVVKRVLEYGYSHHIERLMVLGNFALLWGANPHELNDWFWSLYVDAYEWVVTPNVVGMSQFADGGWIATKPYISSGAYINRMSDYCKGCRYDPKESVGERACPFTTLYWAFLLEHESETLSQRMTQNYFGLKNKTADDRTAILERKAVLLTMVDDL